MPCKSGSKSHFWGFRLIIGHHFSFSQTKQNIQTKQSKQIYVFHRILKCISRQPTSISEVFETALIKIVVLRYKRKWGKKKKAEQRFETWAACNKFSSSLSANVWLSVNAWVSLSASVWLPATLICFHTFKRPQHFPDFYEICGLLQCVDDKALVWKLESC